MEEYIKVLEKTSLFFGIPKEEIENLLECIHARRMEYEKGEMVLWEGGNVNDIGIVLSGCGHSIITDPSGKSFILTVLREGSFIGVLLAASRNRKSPVSVQAKERLSVLFIPFEKIICRCVNACQRHDVLVRNYFDSIAEKSLFLNDRIECLIRPTVREKILTYLTRLAKEEGSHIFMSPLDRSAMAEYINTDRSALSRELSRMKQEGLIDYYKSSFKLLYLEKKHTE